LIGLRALELCLVGDVKASAPTRSSSELELEWIVTLDFLLLMQAERRELGTRGLVWVLWLR
jgi:hypothetical protein